MKHKCEAVACEAEGAWLQKYPVCRWLCVHCAVAEVNQNPESLRNQSRYEEMSNNPKPVGLT